MRKADHAPVSSHRPPRRADLPGQSSVTASSYSSSSLPHKPCVVGSIQPAHASHLTEVVDVSGDPTSSTGRVWSPPDTHIWPTGTRKSPVSNRESVLGVHVADPADSREGNPGLSTTSVAVTAAMAGAVTSADTDVGDDVTSEPVNIHTEGQLHGETAHLSPNPSPILEPRHVGDQDSRPAADETERNHQPGRHLQHPARPMSQSGSSASACEDPASSFRAASEDQTRATSAASTEATSAVSTEATSAASTEAASVASTRATSVASTRATSVASTRATSVASTRATSMASTRATSVASTRAASAASTRAASAKSTRAASATSTRTASNAPTRACLSGAFWTCTSAVSRACSSASPGVNSCAHPRLGTCDRPLSTRGCGLANIRYNNDNTHSGSLWARGRSQQQGRHIRPVSANLTDAQNQHDLLERLRAMYRARRASSATSRAMPPVPQPDTSNGNLGESDHQARTGPPVHASDSHLKPMDRFRQTVRLVVYLQRLMAAMIDNCSHRTMRSASEMQWMTIYAEKHDVTLAFNKHLYTRDRVSRHVPDWAVAVLTKSPEARSGQDCRLLHALLRGMRSFDLFTGEVQMALCRAFTLERLAEGRVVLKSGHVGRHFYLIYSGSVFVNVEDTGRDARQFMRTVSLLSRGQSFGELALLQDIRRTATVSVRERVELLAVDKTVFASVCPKIFERQLAEKYSFLGMLDLFSAKYWSSESIRSLATQAQIQEYKTNKLIVANSLAEDWIYVCMQGRCQVVRCLPLDQPPIDKQVTRKPSAVVLSEEILQLLAATGGWQASCREHHRTQHFRRDHTPPRGLRDQTPSMPHPIQGSP